MRAIQSIRESQYIGVRKFRSTLSRVVRDKRHSFFITEHGKPLKAVIPYEQYLDLLETIEDLRDKELLHAVHESRTAYGKGGWVALGGIKKRLKI